MQLINEMLCTKRFEVQIPLLTSVCGKGMYRHLGFMVLVLGIQTRCDSNKKPTQVKIPQIRKEKKKV